MLSRSNGLAYAQFAVCWLLVTGCSGEPGASNDVQAVEDVQAIEDTRELLVVDIAVADAVSETKEDLHLVDACVPDCQDKFCGPDGCAGTCGDCSEGQFCTVERECVWDCASMCAGRMCGDGATDGGCVCGECTGGYACTADGLCDAECGALCGDDECGEAGDELECICGVCLEYEVCLDGYCELDCDLACASKECTPADFFEQCDCGICDDENPCTADSCQEDGACLFDNVADACDDGDACTSNDMCIEGECAPGEAVICDDGIDCTVDICNPVDGCVAQAFAAACNDGDDCTIDSCSADTGCQHENQPVDCVMGPWGDWGACSVLCGGGSQERTREIVTPAECGGEACGDLLAIEECNAEPCPEDCQWEWSDWSSCEGSCPTGEMSRTVVVMQEALYGGAACPSEADSIEIQECSLVGLVCDDSNPCTASDNCTADGCIGVEVSGQPLGAGGCNDGDDCTEDSCVAADGQMACQYINHPVDCVMSDWSDWGECAGAIGLCVGQQTRTRQITVTPLCGGLDCLATEESQPCAIPAGTPCADGIACTAFEACDGQGVCTVGMQVDAVCDDSDQCTHDMCQPGAEGAMADGCTHDSLAVDCDGKWSDWSDCSAVCGVGSRERSFTVTQEPYCGGAKCSELAVETESCEIVPGTPCDDGNHCTLGDQCDAQGLCSGMPSDQVPLEEGGCNDGDDCTMDSCAITQTTMLGWVPEDTPAQGVEVGSVFQDAGEGPTCVFTSYGLSKVTVLEPVAVNKLGAYIVDSEDLGAPGSPALFFQLYSGTELGPKSLLRCASVFVAPGHVGVAEAVIETVQLEPGVYYVAVGSTDQVIVAQREVLPIAGALSILLSSESDAGCHSCMEATAFPEVLSSAAVENAVWMTAADTAAVCQNGSICNGQPVINEVDFDEDEAAGMGFVEILNPTQSGVDLSGYRVEWTAGDGAVQHSAVLSEGQTSNLLDVGEMIVVGSQALIDSLPGNPRAVPVPDEVVLNSASSGVRIVRTADDAVVDGLARGATVVGTGEGDYAPADPGDGALGRCPGGADSGDNWTDFDLLAMPTPLGANDCENPLAVDCIEDVEWGPWSECDMPCRVGEQTRFYPVLLKPKDGGDECAGLIDSQSCDAGTCDVCSKAGEPYDLYGNWWFYTQGSTVGATNETATPVPGCHDVAPFEGSTGGEVVYAFIFGKCCQYQNAPPIIFNLYCDGCADKLTMYLAKDCSDTDSSCFVGPDYAGQHSIEIETDYSGAGALKRQTTYYLVVEPKEPGVEVDFELQVMVW